MYWQPRERPRIGQDTRACRVATPGKPADTIPRRLHAAWWGACPARAFAEVVTTREGDQQAPRCISRLCAGAALVAVSQTFVSWRPRCAGELAEKAPQGSGAKSAMWAAEPWRTHGNPHRDTTTETVAARGGDMRTAARQGSARSAARLFGFLPSSVLRLPSPARGIRPERRRHCSRSKDATSMPTGG